MLCGPFAMIICYLSLATRVPISCVTSRRGGTVKNCADLYSLYIAVWNRKAPRTSIVVLEHRKKGLSSVECGSSAI